MRPDDPLFGLAIDPTGATLAVHSKSRVVLVPLDAPPPGETTSLGIDALIDGRLNPRPPPSSPTRRRGSSRRRSRTLVGAADAFTNHLYDGHKEREAVNRRLQAIVEDEPLPQILYHPTTTIAFTGDGNGTRRVRRKGGAHVQRQERQLPGGLRCPP